MDPITERFVSEDPEQGDIEGPVSLHRYLYANQSPIRVSDPIGRYGFEDVGAALAVSSILDVMAFGGISLKAIEAARENGPIPDGILLSGRIDANDEGMSVGGGIDLLLTRIGAYCSVEGEIGVDPLSLVPHLASDAKGVSVSLVYGMSSPSDLDGWGVAASISGWAMCGYALAFRNAEGVPGAIGRIAWGADRSGATSDWKNMSINFGYSSSGAGLIGASLNSRRNFNSYLTYNCDFSPISLDGFYSLANAIGRPDISPDSFDDNVWSQIAFWVK